MSKDIVTFLKRNIGLENSPIDNNGKPINKFYFFMHNRYQNKPFHSVDLYKTFYINLDLIKLYEFTYVGTTKISSIYGNELNTCLDITID